MEQSATSDESAGIEMLGPLAVCVWRAKPTSAAVTKAMRLLDESSKRHPSGIMVLTVVVPNCPFPDGPERRALTEGLKRHEGVVRSFAQVILGSGVFISLARGLISAMAIASRQPVKVYEDVATAATWLAQQDLAREHGISAAAIRGIVERLRST